MDSFNPETEVCPICHSKGNCKIHGSYSRSIIDIRRGLHIYQEISVTRILCESCGHTHAILPDTIIPYSQYGIFFILRVLSESFTHLKTVAALCVTYNITPSMLYRWRDLILQNRSVWLSVLEQQEQIPWDFMKSLCLLKEFSEFTSAFFRLTGSSFLQRHANPTALSCRKHF